MVPMERFEAYRACSLTLKYQQILISQCIKRRTETRREAVRLFGRGRWRKLVQGVQLL